MKWCHPKIAVTLTTAIFASIALAGCGSEATTDSHMHEGHEHSNGGDHDMHDGHSDDAYSGSSSKMQESTDARHITITATEYAFDPAKIEAAPGEKLVIKLINKGNTVHMWQLKGMPDTHIHTRIGESATKVITAPEEVGDYKIYCATKGHEELGMVGSLSVTAEHAQGETTSEAEHSH